MPEEINAKIFYEKKLQVNTIKINSIDNEKVGNEMKTQWFVKKNEDKSKER